MADYLDGLNDEQREVVMHDAGPLLVAAVAGCGKTAVVVRRIARLVADGVTPERILAVTFSVKAAGEMNDRLDKLGVTGARVGTFHSVALQILRQQDKRYRSWEIDDRDAYRYCVKDAVGFKQMNWAGADLTEILRFIGLCKAEAAAPNSDRAREIADDYAAPSLLMRAYHVAEQLRVERQLLTFDDFLVVAHDMLRDEQVRRDWAARWDHVIQDEAQDESPVQGRIAAALARDHRNYMIVGDPAQSIFGFRGATPRALLEFESTWGARVVRMGRNYRCGSKIIDAANRSLASMPPDTHLGVDMLAERGVEGVVELHAHDGFDQEGQAVAQAVLESRQDGRRWRDHYVLYRTNAQSRGVEEAMISNRVPYVVVGGTNFYERREVAALLAYLRIASGVGSHDDVKRCINAPFRFLGAAFVRDLGDARTTEEVTAAAATNRLQRRQRESVRQWCEMLDALAQRIRTGTVTPAKAIETIVSETGFYSWLTKDEGSESVENNRVSNVRELIRSAERFPTVAELLRYVEETLRCARRGKKEGGDDRVVLMSLHRSKGLEAPVVFVLGCNERILPHGLCKDDVEERRLFYVGCTRARDALHLSYVRKAVVGSREVVLEPSRFLREIGVVQSIEQLDDGLSLADRVVGQVEAR